MNKSIDFGGLPQFDADLPWDNPQNIEAAEALGLRYDTISKVYRDDDSCPVRDKYGQELG